MPLYDYKCAQHGVFHELASMQDSSKPAQCPVCQKLSARIIMIPPEVLAMAPNLRKAAAQNEKARHEPIVSTADSRMEAQERQSFENRRAGGHQHSGSCKHNHAHHRHSHHRDSHHQSASELRPEQSALKQQLLYLPDGSKIFPSQRPWMISH